VPSAAAQPAQPAAKLERPSQPETAGQGAPEPAPAARPTPEPEPADAAPVQELTLERIKRAWELILQRVQAVRVPLYGFLRDGRPSVLEDDTLTVALPSEFALRNADQNDNADVLATAVEGVLGRRITARFELASGAAAQAAAPAASAAPLPPVTSLPDFTDQIRAAQASLDAELLPDES
jgi:hypothetical protein